MSKLNQIATIIENILEATDVVDDNVLARAIGTVLFDIPVTRSGFVSAALIDEYGYRPSVSKCTNEHFMSRQESGVALVGMYRKGTDINEIRDFLKQASMVHLTLASENVALSKIQNHPLTKDLTWEEQYSLAGIELVEDPGTQPIKERNRIKREAAAL